jgi:hypothetical protein
MGMLVVLGATIVSLQSLEEFTKNLLRDLAPSSF